MVRKPPKLRTVDHIEPPYKLGRFSKQTMYSIAQEITYLLVTRQEPRLEGEDWEKIFALSIGADWKPSNCGLDDVQLGNACWGAKTVKNNNPSKCKSVKLISGRNSTICSYGEGFDPKNADPADVGEKVLEIWNERVAGVRNRFPHCRTVVLVKSKDLLECSVFEFETTRFDYTEYSWEWNKQNNLVGHSLSNGLHRFTWQPHGSQFTIVENVPQERLAFRLRIPESDNISSIKETILEQIDFSLDWIEFIE